ncbi:relaxase/mobilization nuclease domain-containing protein [Marinifilum sp. D714]|uniref:relaxase/mobilization nuclease domain-containing protein n=1 Tax=Marinifilum sp. D714 TaxID=2937523 RepID=UPI0027CCCC1B|nr:relaxase/mobilization nuclease domain-containing protein [Marinifilum sp. D714]MDQ2178562.1 relaxase/mobilization nuclease domain-containing protein [Marinifilum sp. D714]
MIIKIHQSQSVEEAFLYNEKKVEKGEASFFQAGNTRFQNPFLYSKSERLKEFLKVEKLNSRIKNKCLHISVNPSQTDCVMLNDEIFRKEIQNFMEEMGYGAQPYFVYKHQDLDRLHFHVVSSRIDRKSGKKINDSNERHRVQQFVKKLHEKYQLNQNSQGEKIDFHFSPHSRNIKQSLENLFYHLNHTKEIQSKEMYEKTLKLFNVEVRKSGRGHIVLVTDDQGEAIRYPIRLSRFQEKPRFWTEEKKEIGKQSVKKSKAGSRHHGLLEDFIKELNRKLRHQKQGHQKGRMNKLKKKAGKKKYRLRP